MDEFETVDSLFEGLEVGEDVKAALAERVGVHTKGLKNKNTEVEGKLKDKGTALTQLEKDSALSAEKLAAAQGNHEEAERLANKRRSDEKEADRAEIDELTNQVAASNERDRVRNEKTHVTDEISSFAKEFANETIDIDTLELHLARHITMKEVDGKMSTDYGEAGSREALAEIFRKNPVTARHMSGTKATGINALGAQGDGQAGTKKAKELTTEERIAFKQRDPVGFKKAFNLI